MIGEARTLVAERLGLDFPERRSADLERGLVGAASGRDPGAYLARLRGEPAASAGWRRLVRRLTVRESYFFRDPATFDALSRAVLAPLIAERRERAVLHLRLWSAACAAGEEPYSLAILLHRLLHDRADWALTVLATDVDAEALEDARRGLYTRWALRSTPPPVRDRYFRRRGADRFELDPEIREMVTFAPLNLAGDAYPSMATGTGAMDLVVCRNVLMYFTDAARRATVARLREALVEGGWLVVSPVDGARELLRPLTPVELGDCVLYRRDRPDPLPAPAPARAPAAAAAPDPAALLGRARAAAGHGRLEEAAELCRRALALDALAPDAHLLLAAVHEEQGDGEASLTALRAAIYLAPGSVAAHYLLGSRLLRGGAIEPGRRSMEIAAGLLADTAPDAPVPGADGMTAGRLLASARAHLELAR